MEKIRIVQKSIPEIKVDAIVNAANDHLFPGGGVCGAIFKSAGSELEKACQKIGYCDTGSAVITDGFKSKANYIIHAVGPIYNERNKKLASQKLYDAYQTSLDLAKNHDCHSIAFPLISAGIYGYPLKDAWEIALKSCENWLEANMNYDITILFCCIDKKVYCTGCETIKK